MSLFCKVETSSGDMELGAGGGVFSEGCLADCEVVVAGSEVGDGIARSLDARSWEPALGLSWPWAALLLSD